MAMTWFISDTHFGHVNIVEGTSKWTDKSGCRKFDTLEEHDGFLLDVINFCVQPDDVLWHLGDFSFGGKANIDAYRSRINCRTVHLVRGNHDHHIQNSHSYGFVYVKNYAEIVVDKQQFVLMHYPIDSWHQMDRGSIHLHGHTHGKTPAKSNRWDVAPEGLGLTGVNLLARLKTMGEQRHATIEGGSKFAVGV